MEEIAKGRKLISVCIAAYNDEHTIEKIICDSAAVVKELNLDFEILVVNDYSADRTGEILEALSPNLGYLKVINHAKNMGYGSTIKELLYSARGDLIFTLPGDLQIPPEAIRKMLPHSGIYDIVIGSRKPRQDPLRRRINSFIYNSVINIIFHTGTRDINSAKLIKRSVLAGISLVSDGPFIDAELCTKAVKRGFKIREVDIEHRKRMFGSPSGDRLAVMWKAFKETLSMIGRIC